MSRLNKVFVVVKETSEHIEHPSPDTTMSSEVILIEDDVLKDNWISMVLKVISRLDWHARFSEGLAHPIYPIDQSEPGILFDK